MANAIKSDVMQNVVNGAVAEGSKPAVVAKADDLVLNTKQLAVIGNSVNLFIFRLFRRKAREYFANSGRVKPPRNKSGGKM